MSEPLLLDLKSAANFLGTTIWHLRGLIQRGEVPFIPRSRGGNRILVARADLLRWAESAKERIN